MRVHVNAGGPLGSEPRKTGWMRAEAVGDPGPRSQQAILGRGRMMGYPRDSFHRCHYDGAPIRPPHNGRTANRNATLG